MMTAKPLYEEVIDEIGTQTLARFGLNIFSLRTYEAYGASVTMTNDTARAYNQHKNNDKYFGQTFEELDIGMQNIKDSLVNSGNKTYTTDILSGIKNVQELENMSSEQASKQIENTIHRRTRNKIDSLANTEITKLTNIEIEKIEERQGIKLNKEEKKEIKMQIEKENKVKIKEQIKERDEKNIRDEVSKKYHTFMAFIKREYDNEVNNMNFNKGDLGKLAQTNHNSTDTVTLDKNGNVINTAQLKVIKNTNDLLKDRYLVGDSAIDELKVPFEDYKRHRENLKEMITKGKDSNDPKVIEKAEKAKIALEKLSASNVYWRWLCENPRFAAVATQGAVGVGHVVQAGASDAIVVALSTLANGVIWEVKDMYASRTIDSETSVLERIKRLLHKVIEAFKTTFIRGAGFGAIDAIMGIIGQIFTSVASSLKVLWKTTRTSAKSIYNGIYDYASGKIANMRELLSTILKSIFSAAWVVPVIALEQKLALMLPFGSLLAPVFAIIAGAFAVVATCRSIDMALDALFTMFVARDMAKMRAEEIVELVAQNLPELVSERENLTRLIEATHGQRLISLESSFADYQQMNIDCDDKGIYEALAKVNALWKKELLIKTDEDMQVALNQGSGALYFDEQAKNNATNNPILPQT